MPVIASTIVAVAVIAIVIPVAPVWPVIPPVVAIPRITVVGIGVVIARSVVGWVWNGESKGKVNTGARRRFREERQSSDRKNEDNELLHKKETKGMYHKFKKS
jgi:xanthine/uracil permease